MRRLLDILKGVNTLQVIGDKTNSINKIELDSRKLMSKDMFIAIKGSVLDGHQFIDKAIDNGANVIVCEELPGNIISSVTYVQVADSNIAMAQLANNYYEHPSKDIKLVGATGTNGKTTTVTLLYDLCRQLGFKVGLISTVVYKINDTTIPSSHTTPNIIETNKLLAEMRDIGCEYVFMEVSSHAVSQKRIEGLHFVGGVFTNMSHDHLDYHKTFKAYIEAKKSFFDALSPTAFALVNIDDKRGEVMLQNTKAKAFKYSLLRLADFKAKVIENSFEGLQLDLNGIDFYGRLVGAFNAYNYLAVYATACLLGLEREEVMSALSSLGAVEGRFDVSIGTKGTIGIVDYAHTPDALEKVLNTIVAVKTIDAKIITVVGCGGNRDKAKRPIMAKIAADLSDKVVLTSDNPRNEEAEVIIEDMEAGLPIDKERDALSIVQRKQAIKTACQLANKQDVILIAGKGHEKYQEIKGVKYPFDDKQILKNYLN